MTVPVGNGNKLIVCHAGSAKQALLQRASGSLEDYGLMGCSDV
jgi:hypothetical protein